MRSIYIKGQYFSELTEIDLFSDERKNEQTNQVETIETNFLILYGKNGSGKTSISSAFLDYKNELNAFESVEFYDFNNDKIEIDKNSIYVFNDLFTSKNISFKSDDALDAIVLLGDNNDIEEKIKKLDDEIETENKKIQDLNFDKYTLKKSPSNIEEAREKISVELKNHWAAREQEIRGLATKAQVKADFVNTVIELKKPALSQSELAKKYIKLSSSIKSTNNDVGIVEILNISCPLKDKQFYNSLLEKTFEKKSMTGFAKTVFETIEQHSSNYLEETKELITNSGICPVCFRPVDKEFKEKLQDTIELIFNDEIEKEKQALKNEIINPLDKPDLTIYYKIVDATHIKAFENSLDDINKMIVIINNSLKTKIGSIYSPCNLIVEDIDKTIETFKSNLKNLNKDIDEYNSKVRDRQIIIKNAQETNVEMAYYECASVVSNYKNIIASHITDLKTKEESEQKISLLKKEISAYNLKRKNAAIALNEINNCLKYIFGSKKRLYLEPNETGDKYYVVSKGKRIKAKKLSTGEKNIISLVYFYESMKENKNKDSYFVDKNIIVIDDPISSFDYENKIGILSFLKKMIIEIIEGNKNSKIAIFTHEIEIANFLHRIFDDLNMSRYLGVKVLKDKKTAKMNDTKYSNYKTLMVDVFEYALNEEHEKDIYIGNTIRRMLEAYTSFNYSETIDKFLAKQDYRKKIDDEALSEYLFSRMNRLFLNEGSHSETVIRQVPDSMDFDMFDSEEKIKIAKETLLILYCIDSNHVLRYIGENNKRTFEMWKNNIKTEILS